MSNKNLILSISNKILTKKFLQNHLNVKYGHMCMYCKLSYIRYFGRPCDEFAEQVWPIKISDGARVTVQ